VTNQNLEFTQCECNLTPNICDYNCCCDLDCPVILLTKWILDPNNICADKKQKQKNSFTYCFDSNYLIEFNLKRGMRDFKDQNLFCVSFDNSSKKALFYNSMKELKTKDLDMIFTKLLGIRDAKFLNFRYDNRTEYLDKNFSNYIVDDFLFFYEEVNEIAYVEGKFKLMKEGLNGECLRDVSVNWMRDVEEKRCGFVLVFVLFFLCFFLFFMLFLCFFIFLEEI